MEIKKNGFRKLYDNLPQKTDIAPKTRFVREIAKLCYKSEKTVRCWLAGTQTPDALNRAIISKHLKKSENELFNI